MKSFEEIIENTFEKNQLIYKWKTSINELISLMVAIKIKNDNETFYKEFDISGYHPQ